MPLPKRGSLSPTAFKTLCALGVLLVCVAIWWFRGKVPAEVTFRLEGHKLELSQPDLVHLGARYNCLGNTPPTAALLAGFMEPAFQHLVLKKAGLAPTDDEIKSESARVNAETRDPGALRCIQGKYGEDVEGYLRIFISPLVANRKLEAAFKANPDGKEDTQAWFQSRIDGIRIRVANPELLKNLQQSYPGAWWMRFIEQ